MFIIPRSRLATQCLGYSRCELLFAHRSCRKQGLCGSSQCELLFAHRSCRKQGLCENTVTCSEQSPKYTASFISKLIQQTGTFLEHSDRSLWATGRLQTAMMVSPLTNTPSPPAAADKNRGFTGWHSRESYSFLNASTKDACFRKKPLAMSSGLEVENANLIYPEQAQDQYKGSRHSTHLP
jgi:hypothetical protein